jgi:Tfp pilus assembly protein PilN
MKAVNLIPTDQRSAQATGKQSGSAYLVVGVLATLLVMAVAYVFTANSATDRQNKAAVAKAEADRLEAQAAQQDSFTNFAAIKQTRLLSVSTIADSRFDWERMIRELSRVMPSGSWLKSADASVSGDTGDSATASSTTTTTVAAQPSADLVGCTPKQSDVASMLVRLRQMHRVSDVQLNESTTEVGQTGEISFDSCGTYYQFNVTVSFEPAAPSNEAPRGEATVPAALGGGS